MSHRVRRANAGNRLQSLLAQQTPLDDADAEFFAERDDDEDFDLEAEKERLRLERLEAARAERAERAERGENSGEDGDDDSDDESGSGSGSDDENFSSSTDDSESDRDEDPADAGEKELRTEQRKETKQKRIAERNKIFKIKKRLLPTEESQPPANKPPKKKRVFTSADILLEKGRHSERKSAMRNKQYLIEQMREAEQRRAQYIPPKRSHTPKLTQEQRLEEAKKTELRNLSSLNKFVELEEERRYQQRLAMISKRPKLTHFIRFHSTQYMAEPKLIEVVKPEEEELDEDGNPVEPSTAQPQPQQQLQPQTSNEMLPIKEEIDSSKSEDKNEAGSKKSSPEPVSKEAESKESSASPVQKTEPTEEGKTEDAKPELKQETETHLNGGKANDDVAETAAEKAKEEATEKATEKATEEAKEETAENATDKTAENATDNSTGGDTAEPKLEASENEQAIVKAEEPEKPAVYGPAQLRTYSFLTLHEFADVHINKYSIRSIVLGPVASVHHQPPLKRMDPFTGKEAKYIDPTTKVAYSDLKTNKLIQLVKQNKLGWSKELGGVFTTNGEPPRHAKGVPEGFN